MDGGGGGGGLLGAHSRATEARGPELGGGKKTGTAGKASMNVASKGLEAGMYEVDTDCIEIGRV